MSKSRELVLGERDAIVSFLRRKAADCRKHASNLLADTMQSRPDADRWEERAKVCEEAAQQIAEERHWR